MKKMILTLLAVLTMATTVSAMSYEQARNEALFLTDKMAYELNLTDEQYEAAYEINLDYLMGVTGRHDVFGTYWERRNLDLSYILLDWQWNAYLAASYFYRPLYWEAGFWHFGVYSRYPHRDYFYFGRPAFYATYRGGHAWHLHGTYGFYYSYREHFRAPRAHFGMHDRWTRGDFRGLRYSSTRVTGSNHQGRIYTHGGSEPSRRLEGSRRVEGSRRLESGSRVYNNVRGSNLENRRYDRSQPSGNSGAQSGRSAQMDSYAPGAGRVQSGSDRPIRSFGSSGSSFSRGVRSGNNGGFSGSTRNMGSSMGSSTRSMGGGTRSMGGGSFSGGSSRGGGSFQGGGSNSGGSNSGGFHGGGSHVGGRR